MFKEKHYETGLLWKIDYTILPMNRDLVGKILYFEIKLEKNHIWENRCSLLCELLFKEVC